MVISYRPPAETDRQAERKKDGLAVFCRHSRFCDIRCNAVLISCLYTDLLQSTRWYCEVLIEPVLCLSKKTRHAAFGHNFGKMQTDFQNSLTGRFTRKHSMWTRMWYRLLLHLQCVSTLPCDSQHVRTGTEFNSMQFPRDDIETLSRTASRLEAFAMGVRQADRQTDTQTNSISLNVIGGVHKNRIVCSRQLMP